MLKKIVLLTLIALCNAGGYGGVGRGYEGGRGSGRYDGSSYGGGYFSGGLSYGGGFSSGGGVAAGGVIQAAVISKHSVNVRDFDTQSAPFVPQIVEVDAGVLPLTIHFKSASSRIHVVQSHYGSGGGQESTSSEDEPYRLTHSVTKPIIQEVREIITPYRRVIQEIQPVQEEVQTIVSRGHGRGHAVGGGFGGGAVGAVDNGFGGGFGFTGGKGVGIDYGRGYSSGSGAGYSSGVKVSGDVGGYGGRSSVQYSNY